MGQQQLLLLVLGIVIVGLAVVVGIQAFGENQKKSNIDAMVNDGIRIASDAQAWALKPAAFGGGEGVFDDLTFEAIGYTDLTDGDYVNVNGTYDLAVTAGTPGSVAITGTSNNDNTLIANIAVCGLDSNDIETGIGDTVPACE